MSVAITKQGNVYQKTSSGKLGAVAIGAGAGSLLAYKNVDFIKERTKLILWYKKDSIMESFFCFYLILYLTKYDKIILILLFFDRF